MNVVGRDDGVKASFPKEKEYNQVRGEIIRQREQHKPELKDRKEHDAFKELKKTSWASVQGQGKNGTR